MAGVSGANYCKEVDRMIQAEKLSYGFPAKDLYRNISFTLEEGQHCAPIGSNGTGKSTLAHILYSPEDYLYDGTIRRDAGCRIGYTGQFDAHDKARDCTVFQFLSERFTELNDEIAAVCTAMAQADDPESLYDRYQALMDRSEAMGGADYESRIHKSLADAGMVKLSDMPISRISGGEYKILQIMREMLLSPELLILDEPDVFLDFANLGALAQLINDHKAALLVITHNRYLLNHCFDKILHLENGDMQEFDGTYTQYRCSILRQKLDLKLQNIEEQGEIARTQEMVDILRKRATEKVNPIIGRSVNAKQSQLDRLLARQIKEPFIEIREPEIVLPEVQISADNTAPVLTVSDYGTEAGGDLLEHVDLQLMAGEKVALVGPNGAGKTTLVSDIMRGDHPAIHIDAKTRYACLSQMQSEGLCEDKTVLEILQDAGTDGFEEVRTYLARYCLREECMNQRPQELSAGERNLLQIALLAYSDAELLILDEPTSHLDLYAQAALERAIMEYRGAVFMATHDFYLIARCADYVLLVEDNTVRRMRTRKFRKMVYDKYFDSAYLQTDRQRQELEAAVMAAFKRNDLVAADKLCGQLAQLDI